MDYRKAWEAVKLKIEQSVEEGEDRRFNEDSDTRESGMYEAYKKILDHMIELESAETPETPEAPQVSELTLGKMRGKLVESCSSRPDCDGCPLNNTDNCNFSHVDGDHMVDDEIREAFAIMFPEGSTEAASMEAGTLIFIYRAAGAAGAEHKVAVVTDEPNQWGIGKECPGYNVAVLKTGQIWRIPHTSEVDILYRPHK